MGHRSLLVEFKLCYLCIRPIVAEYLKVLSTVQLAKNIMEESADMVSAYIEEAMKGPR